MEARATPQGTKAPEQVYHDLFWAVGGEEAEWRRKTSPAWFGEAQRIAGDRSFFHWQLEFPEVFFEGGKKKENPGWDAVVGNPPYVRQETLGEFKGYFEEKYRVYHGVADLYVYFFERGHQLLRPNGDFGFISSNKFMRSNYGKPLREFLRDGIHIKEIVDFGELPVFPEAATFPAIYLTEKDDSNIPTVYTQVQSLVFESLNKLVHEDGLSLSPYAFEGENWALQNKNETTIMKKMGWKCVNLGEYVNGEIRRGILTGFNEAFFIDRSTKNQLISEDPKCEEIIKPLVVGDDVRKYEINYHDRYIIFTRRGIDIEKYPTIRDHLKQFKEMLTPKQNKNTNTGRKPGNYQWYEIQDTVDYYTDFEKQKIVYPEIAKESRFAIDFNNGYFLNNKCFFIPRYDPYLLSVLNSKLIFFYILRICSILGDPSKKGRAELRSVHMETIPIRRISFSTPEDERRRRAEKLKELCAAGQFEKVLEVVDGCLPKDAAGEFVAEGERSDVVHDLLAHLAEEMIRMNKEKQEEIRGFLAWLEEFIGARIDDISNKTKVSAYYEIEFSELLSIMKKNKRKLACDPNRRAFSEDLRREFSASMEKLSPLLLRIGETDRLIDAIVYRLYGLTAEEIEIVEGSLS
ncbi:MAG: TaqI-like C-terminal specificity domain-containing protein [Methanothrix sp.]|nr:TaqI-like C-terminal specificity domain-containing protein [Methanothrix sp.]